MTVRGRATTYSFFGVALALALAASGFAFLARDVPTPSAMSYGPKVVEILFPLVFLIMPAVGAIITMRHPRHLVGWWFLALGLMGEVVFFLQHYGLYGSLIAPASVPAAGLVLWVATWLWAPLAGGLPICLLLFPTGRLPGPRWRWVVVLAVIGGVVPAIADALRGPDLTALPLESPITARPSLEILGQAFLIGSLTWSAAMLGAAASLVLRFRKARGDERQQLKWFVFGSAVVACVLPIAAVTYGDPVVGEIATALAAISVLAIPIGAGIAILRYRLYDIDVLINRTLVYGAVVAALVATYFAAVVASQAVLRPFTSGNELAVAVSTLLVVALFQPLRRRIQDAVDRRFYRSRYDGARTLDAFGARLRNEVDLDSVRADLLDVVGSTLRPAHASVWLRQAQR